jgi:hypothetical protein
MCVASAGGSEGADVALVNAEEMMVESEEEDDHEGHDHPGMDPDEEDEEDDDGEDEHGADEHMVSSGLVREARAEAQREVRNCCQLLSMLQVSIESRGLLVFAVTRGH